jgi:hypothetical protein
VSTSKHTSIAWRAARGRDVWMIPGLTEFERPFTRAKNARTLSEKRAIAGAVAHDMVTGEHAASWASSGTDYSGEAVAVFRELRIPREEAIKRARAVKRKAAAAIAKAKAEREAEKTAQSLDLARDVNGWGTESAIPAVVFEELARPILAFRESRQREGARGFRWGYFTASTRRESAERWGRELHRAARAAKARGWPAVARKCRVAHKAVRQYIAESHYEAEEMRVRTLRDWAEAARDVRQKAGELEAGELTGWASFSAAKTKRGR